MAEELHRALSHCIDNSRHGEIIRSGIRLAIFGPPNAGKSSLLNFMGTCIWILCILLGSSRIKLVAYSSAGGCDCDPRAGYDEGYFGSVAGRGRFASYCCRHSWDQEDRRNRRKHRS